MIEPCLYGKRRFQCALCGGVYTTDTAVNDIMAEFQSLYGIPLGQFDEETVSLCDECYKIFLKRKAEMDANPN